MQKNFQLWLFDLRWLFWVWSPDDEDDCRLASAQTPATMGAFWPIP